ncbi:MAG: hypothetical protein HOO96_16470 [Polyangiaceae bacterium]|nr:hypothetical protein [Polyangiaceae bacterium]
MTKTALDASGKFEAELARRGVAYVRDAEGNYVLSLDGFEVRISLANLERNVQRDGDAAAVERFVADVLTSLAPEPSWERARAHLFFAAESSELDLGDAIHFEVTPEVQRCLTLTNADESRITFVTPQMCADWGVDVGTALRAAEENQARLLQDVELEVTDIDGEPLGMVAVGSPYKASTVFASTFRALVEPMMGWPVLVVIPCRDFIYVMRNDSPIVGRVGGVVVEEFQRSGYPITTEVLRVSSDGIEALGRFAP